MAIGREGDRDATIPHTLQGYTVTRRYRGAIYHIRVENPHAVQKGVASVAVNGSAVAGNLLPLAKPGETVEVTVVMGEALRQNEEPIVAL